MDVVVSTADLSLGMVNASSPVTPGGALSYTMVFGNSGGTSAPAATLAVPLPPGTSFVSASDGGAASGGIVSWNVGALPSGGTGQRTLAVQVDAQAAVSGAIVAATANLSDAATGRSLARGNAAAAVLSSSDTQVAMSAAPDAVRPGQLVQYAVTVTNRGSVARNYVISAQVPSGTTVAGSAISQVPGTATAGCMGSQNCAAGASILWGWFGNIPVPIAAGQSVTVSFSALVDVTNPPPNGTVLHSTATANGTNGGVTSGASAAVDVVIQGGPSSAPPVLSTDSLNLNFGSVQVGSSKDLALTVTNTGAGTLTGTATPSASYSVVSGTPFNLGAGQSQVVTVRFTPAAAVSVGGQLSIATNGGSASVQLSGTGTPQPAPIVSLSTNVLVFPNTPTNANSLPAAITVTNIGGANLVLGTVSLAGANPADFVIAGDNCSGMTLPAVPAPGSSCTLSVSFGPTLQGTRSASLTIPSNAAGSPSSVSLSGIGLAVPAPAATLSTSSLTFASQVIGANSLPQSVTLTNTGTANLLLGALSVSGTNPGDYLVVTNTCTNATLIPNGTCAFSVSFQPTAAGTRTASVAISSNANGSPHSVGLAGTGVGSPPPPAPCATQAVTWTVGTSTCTATYPGGQSGTSTTLRDITGPTTGTATARCTIGQLALTAQLCTTTSPLPTIKSIDPPRGGKDTVVTIYGKDFAPSQGILLVRFGAAYATVSKNSTDTALEVKIPDGPDGEVMVTVTTAAGESNVFPFRYTISEFQIVEETDSFTNLTEPSLAVDPADASHAVVGFNATDPILHKAACGWAETRNGGKSWKRGSVAFPNGFQPRGDPWVKFAPDGHFVYSCVGVRPATNSEGVFAAVSMTRYAEDLKPEDMKSVFETQRSIDRPSFGFLTINGRTRTVACWTVGRTRILNNGAVIDLVRIQSAYSDDPSLAKWSAPSPVSISATSRYCSVGGNGADRIAISWYDSTGGQLKMRSSVNGDQWSVPVVLDSSNVDNGSISTSDLLRSNPYAQVVPGTPGTVLQVVWQKRTQQKSQVVVGKYSIDTRRVAPQLIGQTSSVAGSETFLPGSGSCGKIAGAYQVQVSDVSVPPNKQFSYSVWSLDNLSQPIFTSSYKSNRDNIVPDPDSSRRIGDYMGTDCTGTSGWAAWIEVRQNQRLEVWGARFPLK